MKSWLGVSPGLYLSLSLSLCPCIYICITCSLLSITASLVKSSVSFYLKLALSPCESWTYTCRAEMETAISFHNSSFSILNPRRTHSSPLLTKHRLGLGFNLSPFPITSLKFRSATTTTHCLRPIRCSISEATEAAAGSSLSRFICFSWFIKFNVCLFAAIFNLIFIAFLNCLCSWSVCS